MYYIDYENHEVDEATFWGYVMREVNDIYQKGSEALLPLYGMDYWGDCDVDESVLTQIINAELNKIIKNES